MHDDSLSLQTSKLLVYFNGRINYKWTTIFREEAADFHAGPLSWSNRNLEMLVFVESGKPENPEKNPRSKARTNKKLNPHMTPGRNRARATLAGGEHPPNYAIPAPHKHIIFWNFGSFSGPFSLLTMFQYIGDFRGACPNWIVQMNTLRRSLSTNHLKSLIST